MELNTHICRQLVEKGRAFTQITLDDDYIVKDNKPDVIRTIYSKAEIRFEDVKAGNQAVWITGRLHFSTLYLSDNEDRRLDCLEGDIPFQEKMIMDEVTENDECTVEATLEDLNIGIINSRKLVIRAVISLSGVGHEEEDHEITCGIEADTNYETRTAEMEMLCLVDAKRDVIRMQKEMVLPNARTNIGEIIFSQVDFRNQDTTMKEDGIGIQMDAQVWVLYRSESTGEYECFETTVPLSGEVEMYELMQNDIYWARIMPMEVQVEPREDYDGEARMLGLEVSFTVELELYREESCQMLQDAYSLDKELLLEQMSFENVTLLMKNLSKVRLLEQEKIEPNQERILQICGSSGRLVLDRVQKTEKGIMIEGILFVSVLYNTVDDSMPYQSHNSQIPFEQFIEMEDSTEEAKVRLSANVEQLQVNLLDNTEYEVKAAIQIAMLATRPQQLSNIARILEEDLDMEALQKQPGIIGVWRTEGEELWDIAKKYHATAENIIELADKVLVVKQVR